MAQPDPATQAELDRRLKEGLASIGAKPKGEGFGEIAQSFNTAPARAIRGLADSPMFASGITESKDPSATTPDPTGDNLLTQVLTNYSEFMKANNISPQDVIQSLGGEANVGKFKNATDITNALNQLGAQTNWQYKVAHPTPINSSQMQQLLGTITGYQKPYLDAMKAETGLAGSMIGDFAKYMSPQSRAAYGDLSKAYQGEANTLSNVIPAENPAAILNMMSGGGTTASTVPTGVAGLAQLAGLNPTTLTAPTAVKTST